MSYKPRPADLVVVSICAIVAAAWVGHAVAVWQFQDTVKAYKQAPKKCALYPGETPISTTADICYFSVSYGKAIYSREAK